MLKVIGMVVAGWTLLSVLFVAFLWPRILRRR